MPEDINSENYEPDTNVQADEVYVKEKFEDTSPQAQQKVEHELTRWQAIKEYPKSFGWCMGIVWAMILVGYENQASGIVLSIPQFRQDFGYYYDGSYVLPSNWQSAITGGPLGAIALSSFCSSYLSDRFGRKWVLSFAILFTIPFVTMEFVATTIQIFFVGKFLNALCLGVISTIGITMASEYSPMALRGFIVACCSLSLCVGPFICYLINNTTSAYTTRMAYRGVFLPQWIFSITCLPLFFMPESPFWLLKVNRHDAARKSLLRLFNPVQAEQQFGLMLTTVEESIKISDSSTYADCFRKKDIRRTLIVLF
ncbi:hypothetical protein FOA43_003199 [Brettanomyces nanus]|uniref:Major facilitator superfamily (MFS) profile domain-containing protein n=1 Tax=Eeniella nana TaxID=13502 RepID=A0A875RVV2_EENNA|nr:uncharacterized protein FOA43_003199 [Brettanomyces nanus]QPG75837.1 hypothetical protein FOA43_003199 [Brettanomyces nanus]